MKPVHQLVQRLKRLDRERARAFGSFLWHRFLDDHCFESAGALSFTTVFALVPLTLAVFGVLSAFPIFDDWWELLSDFIFSNFVPEAARAVEEYFDQFAGAATRVTGAGVLSLLISAIVMMASIEETYNRIWRVQTPRRRLARFLVYWTVLTLGPILIVASLGMSSYLFSLPVISRTAVEYGLAEKLLALIPVAVELSAFTLSYIVVPNRTVSLRHALAGGVLATILFELAKFAFALYLTQVPAYQRIYGTLALIPIFLLWIYLSWVVVLLGASFAASLSAFRFQPARLRLPAGFELFGLLRLIGRFAQVQRSGDGLHTEQLHVLEPALTDDLLQRMLADLAACNVLQRTESGAWVLSRDLQHVTLAELYEAGALRIPIAEAWLPCRDDTLGHRAGATLDDLRLTLREHLRVNLATIFRDRPAEDQE